MVSTLDVVMKEQSEYYFKRLDPSLYNDLIYISKSAFGFDPGRNYYKQKNETAVFGPPFLGYIAYSESHEPAAFYGVYACQVEFNSQIYVAAQSGDTMTHKSHTGKGLFTKLARMTYELAKQEGISFIFGFPNKNSYPGFVKKLEWVCPACLREYRQKVFTIPLAKLAKKIKVLAPLYRIYTTLVFKIFGLVDNGFENSSAGSGVITLKRTKDFILYKSFSGNRLVNVNSFKMWVKADGFLYLGDIEKKAQINFEKINTGIRRLAFWLGCDVILFHVSPGAFWDNEFKKHLDSTDSLYYGYLNLDGKLPLEKLAFVMADSDTF